MDPTSLAASSGRGPTSPSASSGHGKIPSRATRVHTGIIFEVYQWQQTMFDGSVGTFEAVRRVPGTEIIIADGDEILIAEQEQPGAPRYLSLFGGRIEPDEDPLESAKRELLEESGYTAERWELVERSNSPWSKFDWVTYLYLASDPHEVQEPTLDAGEKITVRRVSIDEFLELGRTEIRWKHPAALYQWTTAPDAKERLTSLLGSRDR